MKNLISQGILSVKNIRFIFYKPSKFKYLIKDMPYYSQFVSPNLIDNVLQKKIRALDDPRWKESGAETKNEYEIWGHNGCGMACFKMILEKKTGKKVPLVKLCKLCKKYGGYTDNKKAQEINDYTDYYKGLFYKPFISFIKNEFQLQGHIISPMTQKEIMKALATGKFVIASVHPDIKTPNEIPRGNRGHLVVIVGYDTNKKLFYLHNPSGVYRKSQEYAKISFSDFDKFFAKRGIIID